MLYDARIVDGFRLHADRFATLDTPALVIDDGQTHGMSSGAQALADALQQGPSPDVVAAVLIEFFEA